MLMDYYLKNNVNAFLTSMSTLKTPNITVAQNGWKLSTGAYYDSNTNTWKKPIGSAADEAKIVNAGKEYEKQTQYFGYGEGNEHRTINGNIPTVVGESGWINSSKLVDAADKYSSFDSKDEVVVLVSEGDIILTDTINNKKGIIVAGGNVTVDSDIDFEGTLICGGKLIVNNYFRLYNNSVAINKIIESAVSTDNKELFEIFQDDGSGNLYTYSTIDTQIASINMNDLIKISNWKKSKFDI